MTERDDYVEPGPDPLGAAWRRLKVVVPGFAIGLLISLYGATNVGRIRANPPAPKTVVLLVIAPAAGPFIWPAVYPRAGWIIALIFGGSLLMLIALHPACPNPWTAFASGFGILLWFLFGFAAVYSGV